MTWEEFKANYNNLRINPTIVVPPFLQPVLNIYEEQASNLSADEKETLALGDDEDRESLVQRTGYSEFDDFLTEAFEGMLSDIFWHLPS